MKVAIGSDHGGFRLKEELKTLLNELKVEFHDFGTYTSESVDYPDISRQVAESVAKGEYERGIIVCGTGIGVSIAANKIKGIRAALCNDVFSAQMSREHNDANILTLGERVIGFGLARMIVEVWLNAKFAGGRHACRVDKIMALEKDS
ncbi:ribose 5-phosphate isomerase B [Sporomusa acidovorans]|uniref:Sugar phosphate isomerase YwlF n=1 Tax=Sporomusa acidovorans (strain ATCC 49682 / DSM 3132 / Mol) TaxID=1123286 RepID=A0ABZ3J827_SPOA4|nr:ribose 5-phosphate isomerase B [Sporomusa acidovorans]OZC21198.1 putative sugar phosphate isomerase YwlF [Sporomusa acidovorans DSM 3132]SDE64498.1 ribose 5-phosphate isomerase B [Sporomusa acidovorans]